MLKQTVRKLIQPIRIVLLPSLHLGSIILRRSDRLLLRVLSSLATGAVATLARAWSLRRLATAATDEFGQPFRMRGVSVHRNPAAFAHQYWIRYVDVPANDRLSPRTLFSLADSMDFNGCGDCRDFAEVYHGP